MPIFITSFVLTWLISKSVLLWFFIFDLIFLSSNSEGNHKANQYLQIRGTSKIWVTSTCRTTTDRTCMSRTFDAWKLVSIRGYCLALSKLGCSLERVLNTAFSPEEDLWSLGLGSLRWIVTIWYAYSQFQVFEKNRPISRR